MLNGSYQFELHLGPPAGGCARVESILSRLAKLNNTASAFSFFQLALTRDIFASLARADLRLNKIYRVCRKNHTANISTPITKEPILAGAS